MKNKTIKTIVVTGLLLLVGLTVNSFAQGKKYGLFVGINRYPEPVHALRGCVNDALNFHRRLTTQYGFAPENTTVLTDGQATRDGILNNLKAYQAQAQAGDLFVFTYSGHGTLFPDRNSEEQDETEVISVDGYYAADRYDSALCPIDLRDKTSGKPWSNLILDDELFTIFSGFTAKGAMVLFISDSCHSGTMARGLGAQKMPAPTAQARFLPYSTITDLKSIPMPVSSRSLKRSDTDAKGLLIVLSGAKDNEFSLDYPDAETGETNGLFTKTLLLTLDKLKSNGQKATYMTIQTEVSPEVHRLSAKMENSQTPQLDARFFSGNLESPIFEFAGTPPTSNLLRVVVKVTDKQGTAVDSAALGIFSSGINPSLLTKKGGLSELKPNEIIATGRTNQKGLFDSNTQSILLPKGNYYIKVLHDGYQSYIGKVTVEENVPGYCVLVVRLEGQ